MSLDPETLQRHQQAWLEYRVRSREGKLEQVTTVINDLFDKGDSFTVTIHRTAQMDTKFTFEDGPKR